MTLGDIIQRESKSEIGNKLVTELSKYSKDEEFIAGVLLDVQNEDDKKALLNYILDGKDVDYEQILLNALWLSQQREK